MMKNAKEPIANVCKLNRCKILVWSFRTAVLNQFLPGGRKIILEYEYRR
jgi:hypothetical protein